MPGSTSPPAMMRRAAWHDAAQRALVGALVLVVILPLVAAFATSLDDASLDHYRQWWTGTRGWEILGRTFLFASLASAVACLAAWPIAAFAAHSFRRAVVMGAITSATLLVPSSVLATAWIMAWGRDGVITDVTEQWFGSHRINIYWFPFAATAVGLRYFGIAVVLWTFEMARQRRGRFVESAFKLSAVSRLVWLRLRPALRVVAAAWVIIVILAANDHIMPGMFLVQTFGVQMLIQFSAFGDGAGATALAMPVLLICMVVLCVALRRGAGFSVAASAFIDPPVIDRGSRPRRIAHGAAALAIVGFAIVAPLVMLGVRAGSVENLMTAARDARAELLMTGRLASIAAILCILLAAPLAAGWVRAIQRREFTAVPSVVICLAAPPSLIAIGTIALFQHSIFPFTAQSHWPLILGYVARFAPLAALVLVVLWSRRSPAPMQAAALHRVSVWRRLWALQLPTRGPELLAATLICFILIATELEISVMLVPAGVTTMGVRIYTLIHTAPDAVVSALVCVLLLLITPLIGLLCSVASRLLRYSPGTG